MTTKLPDDRVLRDGHDEEGLGDHDPAQVKENVIDEVVAVAEVVLSKVDVPSEQALGPSSRTPNLVADDMVPLRSDANLRVTPSTSAEIVAVESRGDLLEVTGPSVTNDGYVWWPILVINTGATGYIVEDLLITEG